MYTVLERTVSDLVNIGPVKSTPRYSNIKLREIN